MDENTVTKTLATKGAAAETAPRANARARETIVAEIHALVGTKYFDIGDRLIELRDCCEPGEWRNALKHEFAWSEDTAARYMASARLAFRVRTVRNLKVPPTIIYDLAQNHADDDDLPAIIEALAKASRHKTLPKDQCHDVIYITQARCKFGDLPEATLKAINDLDDQPKGRLELSEPWRAKAMDALKAARPETAAEADKIVGDIHRAHTAASYAPIGKLPDNVPADALDNLDEVPDERRKYVLQKLLALPSDVPIAAERISEIRWYSPEQPEEPDESRDDGSESSDDESGVDDATKDESIVPPETPETVPPQPLDPDLLGGLNTILHHARRAIPREVAGITGPELAEINSFVEYLHRRLTGDNEVKMAADRAEARTKAREAADRA